MITIFWDPLFIWLQFLRREKIIHVHNMSLRNNGTKDKDYQHSGTHLAELPIMLSKYVQQNYTKLQACHMMLSDIIMGL